MEGLFGFAQEVKDADLSLLVAPILQLLGTDIINVRLFPLSFIGTNMTEFTTALLNCLPAFHPGANRYNISQFFIKLHDNYDIWNALDTLNQRRLEEAAMQYGNLQCIIKYAKTCQQDIQKMFDELILNGNYKISELVRYVCEVHRDSLKPFEERILASDDWNSKIQFARNFGHTIDIRRFEKDVLATQNMEDICHFFYTVPSADRMILCNILKQSGNALELCKLAMVPDVDPFRIKEILDQLGFEMKPEFIEDIIAHHEKIGAVFVLREAELLNRLVLLGARLEEIIALSSPYITRHAYEAYRQQEVQKATLSDTFLELQKQKQKKLWK